VQVTTRNLTQIRSHAQKYFKKLERDQQKQKVFNALACQDKSQPEQSSHKRQVDASDDGTTTKRQKWQCEAASNVKVQPEVADDTEYGMGEYVGVFSLGDTISSEHQKRIDNAGEDLDCDEIKHESPLDQTVYGIPERPEQTLEEDILADLDVRSSAF
jgi:hypothetical protein